MSQSISSLRKRFKALVGPKLRQWWGVITSKAQCSTWGCCWLSGLFGLGSQIAKREVLQPLRHQLPRHDALEVEQHAARRQQLAPLQNGQSRELAVSHGRHHRLKTGAGGDLA